MPYARNLDIARRAQEIALTEKHPSMRIVAIEALIRARDGTSTADLTKVLSGVAENDPKRRVRTFAAAVRDAITKKNI